MRPRSKLHVQDIYGVLGTAAPAPVSTVVTAIPFIAYRTVVFHILSSGIDRRCLCVGRLEPRASHAGGREFGHALTLPLRAWVCRRYRFAYFFLALAHVIAETTTWGKARYNFSREGKRE